MKEYDVTITETLQMKVPVEAESREAAKAAVQEIWSNAGYILGAENFTGVEFDVGEGRELEQDAAGKMNVLLVCPGKYPKPVEIGTSLEDMQKAVGGDIEAVYPYEEEVALVTNEEGKINGLPPNRALRTEDGELYNIIAGDFLVVGLWEEDFASLTPEQMKHFEEVFHQPETFIKMGRSSSTLQIRASGTLSGFLTPMAWITRSAKM